MRGLDRQIRMGEAETQGFSGGKGLETARREKLGGILLQNRQAVCTRLLGENQHLASVEHGQLTEMVRQRLLESGEDHAMISVQTEATLSRWLEQEAALLVYHDVFAFMAVTVLLTAVPVLWLRQRRGTACALPAQICKAGTIAESLRGYRCRNQDTSRAVTRFLSAPVAECGRPSRPQ